MLKTAAIRGYNRRVMTLSIAYAVLLIGSVYGFNHHLLEGPIAYVAAILTALPIVGIFAAIGLYLVEESDEYVRLLMVRQTLVASGLLLSVATIWGFLETFKLVSHVDAYWAAILWFAGLGLGACVNKLTVERQS